MFTVSLSLNLFQLLIAEMTLFYGPQDRDLAIGLALTILLVVYTMYQSVQDSLPKTAYLKLIDIWLMFCLFVPFLVFLIQLMTKVSIKKGFGSKFNAEKLLGYARIVLPLTSVLFVAVYLAQAIQSYSNP